MIVQILLISIAKKNTIRNLISQYKWIPTRLPQHKVLKQMQNRNKK